MTYPPGISDAIDRAQTYTDGLYQQQKTTYYDKNWHLLQEVLTLRHSAADPAPLNRAQRRARARRNRR